MNADTEILTRVMQLVAQTKKLGSGVDGALLSGQHYMFNLTTRKGAKRFSTEKLAIALAKKGWSLDDVQKLIESCQDDNEPSKIFKVVELL